MTEAAEPTERDRQNAAARQIIAQREQREYGLALGFCVSLFGTGWTPHGYEA